MKGKKRFDNNYQICYNFIHRWHIILVNRVYYEGGAKNPLKSIPVKLLVLASYAQFGVSAGNESVGRL